MATSACFHVYGSWSKSLRKLDQFSFKFQTPSPHNWYAIWSLVHDRMEHCWRLSKCGRRTLTVSLRGWRNAPSAIPSFTLPTTPYPDWRAKLVNISSIPPASISGSPPPTSLPVLCARLPFEPRIETPTKGQWVGALSISSFPFNAYYRYPLMIISVITLAAFSPEFC